MVTAPSSARRPFSFFFKLALQAGGQSTAEEHTARAGAARDRLPIVSTEESPRYCAGTIGKMACTAFFTTTGCVGTEGKQQIARGVLKS